MVQAWDDNTGLHRVYGPDKAIPAAGGEIKRFDQLHEIDLKIDLTKLTSSPVILENNTFLGKVRFHEVVVIAETAATSSGSATLDIGLQNTDRTTELDYNGLVAAQAKTTLTPAGTQTVSNVGSTYAGALLGTTTTQIGYLTANYNTAAFTAGVVQVKIRYYYP